VNYKNSNIFLFYLVIVLREGLISLSDEFVNTSNAIFLTESDDNDRLSVQLLRCNSGIVLERGYACIGEFSDNEFTDFGSEMQNSVDVNWDCILLLKMREIDVKRKWLFDVLNEEEFQKRKSEDKAFEFDSYFDKIKDTPYIIDTDVDGAKTSTYLTTPVSNEVLFNWLEDRFKNFISTLKDDESITEHGFITVQNIKQICYSIFIGLSEQILIKKYADRFFWKNLD